jgi:hypothetical protein
MSNQNQNNPGSKVVGVDRKDQMTFLGPPKNIDPMKLQNVQTGLPAQNPSPGVIVGSKDFTQPLGAPAPMKTAITPTDMSNKISIGKQAFETAMKPENNKLTPQNFPFLNNSQLSAVTNFFRSPEFSSAIQESVSNTMDSSGMTDEISQNLRKFNNLHETGMLRNSKNSIRDNNQIIKAQRQLMAAEDFFYNIIKIQCPDNTTNPICKKFKNLQNTLLDAKINVIVENKDNIVKKISEQIIAYYQQTIALLRLRELLASRIDELSSLEYTLNNLNTNIRVNTRENFYKNNIKNENRENQIVLIYVYYNILILYMFVSNFFPEENYKKFLPLLFIFLYLILPFILQYIIQFLYNINIDIQKIFGNYPRNVHTIKS